VIGWLPARIATLSKGAIQRLKRGALKALDAWSNPLPAQGRLARAPKYPTQFLRLPGRSGITRARETPRVPVTPPSK
jgi:hypothetical protein